MGDTGIRLLGDVAVVHHGEVRRPSTQRPRIILALPALHAGNPVDTNSLIDETWGEELPANPRAALQVYVTRLRPWLDGVASISGSGGGYALGIDPRDVDLLAFLAAAELALQGSDPARYDEAVALWQEPVLPELSSPRLNADRAHAEERRRALG